MEAMTDREKLTKLVEESFADQYDRRRMIVVPDTVNHLLTNGVVVREKGEWVYDHWCEFKCSKCGTLSKTEPRGEESFCPNCGADMRWRENDG